MEKRNIIITGGGRGIGREVAIACAKEGANVGLVARTREELDGTKSKIDDLGLNVKVVVKTADITDYSMVDAAFKEFHDELGLLNGVIANAGYSKKSISHEFPSNDFDDVMKVNVLGVFNTFKAAYPFLAKEDKKDRARFLITGSAAYPIGMGKFAAYTASKFAVVGLVKSLCLEYSKEYIDFNVLLPTMVDTKLLRGSKAGDGNKPPTVMNPWDLNEYYVFLMSREASKINGYLIDVSDLERVKRAIAEAPADKRESDETIKAYIEETLPGVYKNLKKLRKIAGFLLNR
ncbi:MAG: SDR family oxidoreductase [Promethearchaeota archaeon]